MNVYMYDEKTKEYLETRLANKDPLESIVQGKDVWLLPANASWKSPLIPKDNFAVVWDNINNCWVYLDDERGTHYWIDEEEFIMDKLGKLPKNASRKKPKKPEPTVKEKNEIIRQKREDLYIQNSDYLKNDYLEAWARNDPNAENLKNIWLESKDKIRKENPYIEE